MLCRKGQNYFVNKTGIVRPGPYVKDEKSPQVFILIRYSRLSLSRNRRDPQKQFEISELRHIRFVVLRKKQFEQPIFKNDYVI